ncbi:hypothetical protein [Streptomyces zaehneri]|uniref:hypothetical protein n=1 Tax=Streptomyces zaehneri TaxID=3051180 RepID=UPI0028D1D79C|nr:hypothetical protein [Streptomyces sp. DSM 40713]
MTSPPGDGDRDASTTGPRPLVCARCGAGAEEPPPVTWTCSVENGVRHYFCEACARENLRAIEGRLDSEWW